MIWISFVLIFFFLVFYLLFAPIYLQVDSRRGLIGISFHQLIKARLQLHDRSLFLEMKILGWPKQVDLLAAPVSKKTRVKERSKITRKSGFRFRRWWMVLKTFRTTTCDISIDTGSMPLNGALYPLFYLLSTRTKKSISINFRNENRIILEIQNNLARMVWAFIRTSITNKKTTSHEQL